MINSNQLQVVLLVCKFDFKWSPDLRTTTQKRFGWPFKLELFMKIYRPQTCFQKNTNLTVIFKKQFFCDQWFGIYRQLESMSRSWGRYCYKLIRGVIFRKISYPYVHASASFIVSNNFCQEIVPTKFLMELIEPQWDLWRAPFSPLICAIAINCSRWPF